MTKQKQIFRNVGKFIKNVISHKYSDPLLSSLLKHLWQRLQPWVFYKLGTPVFGELLPFFSTDPLKLCQVGWGVSLHSDFQVSPEMFNRVQVRALAGPVKDIQSLVPKPILSCLGCVLWVVVLLECDPSPQSEFLSALEQVFIKELCTLLSSSFPRSWLVSQSLLLKEIPHSMMLPPLCFTVGMLPGFLQMWFLAFRTNSSILVSSDQRILFLMVWESFRCLLANSKWAVMCLLLRSGFHLPTLP